MANQSFQTFGEENVGELLIILLATLANLEFSWVKYWRMMYSSPNSPKFSPARILRYTVSKILIRIIPTNFGMILVVILYEFHTLQYINTHKPILSDLALLPGPALLLTGPGPRIDYATETDYRCF